MLDLPGDDLQEQRRAIIENNLKLIVSRNDQRAAKLFDLEADPEERKNLAPVADARLRHMQALYARVSAGMASGKVRGGSPVKISVR